MTRVTKWVVGGFALATLAAAGLTFHFTRHATGAVAASADEGCETGGQCSARAHIKGGAGPVEKPKGPRILAFSSVWCAACQKMAPVVAAAERACSASGDVTHVDIDGDTGSSLATTYAVSSIPAWLSIDADGNEVSRLVGVQHQWEIEQAIEEVRGRPCAAVDRAPSPSGVPM